MRPVSTVVASRRQYIDWTRGLAVLIMIEAHALDAWTRNSSRSTPAYQYLSMLGGFAAPLFLWLAGLSLVLAAERTFHRTGSRSTATEAIVRRGAEIFILAFLFRLQAFVVSPGSWLVTIFRVDILNVMGPAIAVTGLVWGIAGSSSAAALASAALAVTIAMTTPLVRVAGWVDALPLWLQWYVRPFGDHTTFTLFPWSGFVLGGAAVGALLATTDSPPAERRILAVLGGAGVLTLWLGFYTASQPSIYPVSNFWTTSPTYFAIRIGVMLIALTALSLVAQLGLGTVPGLAPLEKLGRNSLFIYWIHIEIVYGYATWAIHRRLPLWGTALAFGIFVIGIYSTIALRDSALQLWRASRAHKSGPQTVAT